MPPVRVAFFRVLDGSLVLVDRILGDVELAHVDRTEKAVCRVVRTHLTEKLEDDRDMPSESQVHQLVDALAVGLEAFGFNNDVVDLVRLELNVPERKPARSVGVCEADALKRLTLESHLMIWFGCLGVCTITLPSIVMSRGRESSRGMGGTGRPG